MRDVNQDSYVVLRRSELGDHLDGLFVVADGMGGGRGGEVASRIVAQTLPEAVGILLTERNGAIGDPDTVTLLRNAILRANQAVRMRQSEDIDLRRMGTTCLAALLQGDTLTVGNVGDSRAYLLRTGKLRQLTEDHSDVWQQVKAGHMTREEARHSPFRNSVTRAIGLRSDVAPDVESHRLLPGDALLLCSDGLSTELSDAEIAQLLATASDAQEAADRLVKAALHSGGRDNVTAIVMHYGPFTRFSPSIASEQSDLMETDSEEEETDPEALWRRATEEARVPGDAGRPGERRMVRRTPIGRLGAVLLVLLLGVSAAAGYGLYRAQQRITELERRPVVVPPPPRPTDGPLFYGKPKPVLEIPVLEAPLVVDADGAVLVVTMSRKVIRISPRGEVTVLPTASHFPDISGDPQRAATRSRTRERPRAPVYMALDPSGNRYQTDPVDRVIDKYNAAGARVLHDIGKGSLTAPASLGVDPLGSLYVIDGNRLKKIEAATRAVPTASEQRRNTQTTAPTRAATETRGAPSASEEN